MLFKKLSRVIFLLVLILLLIASSLILLMMLWIPLQSKVEIAVKNKDRVTGSDVENFVQCIDGMSRSDSSIQHQLVFIGDSRMRQQFYSFIQVMPDYDRVWKRPEGDLDMILATCHCDLDVTSPLLGLKVSYRFRPLVDAALIDELKLVISNSTTAPRLILLGNCFI
jgi:hypothetical protein